MVVEEIQDFSKGFPYKSLTIFLILTKFLIKTYIELREYKRINSNKPLPKKLKELDIDEEKFKQSNIYSKAKLEFNFIKSTFTVLLETLLFVFNYYPFVWEISRKIALKLKFNQNNEYILCYIYMIIEYIRGTIIDIPFNLYKTFILEEKFGFNKTTMKTSPNDKLYTIGTLVSQVIDCFVLRILICFISVFLTW